MCELVGGVRAGRVCVCVCVCVCVWGGGGGGEMCMCRTRTYTTVLQERLSTVNSQVNIAG